MKPTFSRFKYSRVAATTVDSGDEYIFDWALHLCHPTVAEPLIYPLGNTVTSRLVRTCGVPVDEQLEKFEADCVRMELWKCKQSRN